MSKIGILVIGKPDLDPLLKQVDNWKSIGHNVELNNIQKVRTNEQHNWRALESDIETAIAGMLVGCNYIGIYADEMHGNIKRHYDEYLINEHGSKYIDIGEVR